MTAAPTVQPARGAFATAGLPFLDRFAVFLSTAGGIGYAPKAPGTWGSLPGLALGIAFQQLLGPTRLEDAHDSFDRWIVIALALAAATVVAWWSIHRTERALHVHDDGRIVVDEVVGQACALAYLPSTVGWTVAAFALFRLLDIWKPLAIGWIDEHGPGAVGTLGDDVLAGVVAGGALVAVSAFL